MFETLECLVSFPGIPKQFGIRKIAEMNINIMAVQQVTEFPAVDPQF